MAFEINRKKFNDLGEFAKRGRGCATKIPTPIEIMRVDEEIRANKTRRRLFDQLIIKIKFIHLTYGSFGSITEEQRKKQITVLNKALNGTGISFIYEEPEVIFVDSYNWYYMGHRSASERKAKKALSTEIESQLNFYTGGLQPGLLGWATFPFDLAGDPEVDGVVVLDESLPDGKEKNFNLGMTAVHEVCHWLGLYHTFQDGCQGIGDHVQDTPAHKGPNTEKPEKGKPHNACNEGEFAPIHNYMNYVDDAWMNELTSQQQMRIKEQVMMYRPGLIRPGLI